MYCKLNNYDFKFSQSIFRLVYFLSNIYFLAGLYLDFSTIACASVIFNNS